ncbi:GMP synthase [Halarcobacter ebronensis]|uniref:GMP synthase n=1 Tax=Halarcobacter ebronensis TaxID=1462615 RepID=A0A4V1LRH2_9BACT|nr:glutamine amidotransferase [Halarcobacter ebronensis]RXJ68188.1 GMP synthase [Halarcobacter ebronensis]
MKKLFIIKAGTTFKNTVSNYGDFEDWVIEKLDNENLEIEIIDVQAKEALPSFEDCAGVIITGSHSMVTDEEPWSVELEKWIPSLVEKDIALLGICYGHQLMAKSLGGVSSYHKNGMEIGTVEIELEEEAKEDRLFNNLPKKFKAHTIHSQTALTLPKNAIRLAYNKHDSNHAFRVGKKAWGVQFHPEYSRNIMNSYIKEVSKAKELPVEKLLKETEETPIANLILKRFGELVEKEVNND